MEYETKTPRRPARIEVLPSLLYNRGARDRGERAEEHPAGTKRVHEATRGEAEKEGIQASRGGEWRTCPGGGRGASLWSTWRTSPGTPSDRWYKAIQRHC